MIDFGLLVLTSVIEYCFWYFLDKLSAVPWWQTWTGSCREGRKQRAGDGEDTRKNGTGSQGKH